MRNFLETEKSNQVLFKAKSPSISDQARSEGLYKGFYRPFCLPVQYAEQNIYPEIRDTALSHFSKNNIKWHDGKNGNPSNHLCSSQVCCVNFLFPFANKPKILAESLRPLFPKIKWMIPVEDDVYVSFEWIGQRNYLGEKIRGSGKRSRGALFTSADSIVMFERNDNLRQIVLIEWKYTESYGSNFKKFAKSGTDRTKIYQHLYERKDCPINKDLLSSYDSLFYEPFYQFFRQQLLANEMEKAQEMGADIVSVLHIAPSINEGFSKITSPDLKMFGETATSVWNKLVKSRDRFISITTEELFSNIAAVQSPEFAGWAEYIQDRYQWVCDG